MFEPAWESVGEGPRRAFVLHGILGSRGNWRGFSRRLVREHPGWRLVLVDLRNHGDSHGAPGPHTVATCAADLVTVAQRTGPPEVVVGHSFGGKVALAYARDHGAELQQVWALDSPPGPRAVDGGDVAAVVDAIRRLPMPVSHRAAVVTHFRALGFSEMVAGWMTTNLRRLEGEASFNWRFDLQGVEEMLTDYAHLDLRGVVAGSPADIHLLRAGRNDRWSPEDARLVTDVLPDAGHWVHVDDPDGLLEVIRPTFASP